MVRIFAASLHKAHVIAVDVDVDVTISPFLFVCCIYFLKEIGRKACDMVVENTC